MPNASSFGMQLIIATACAAGLGVTGVARGADISTRTEKEVIKDLQELSAKLRPIPGFEALSMAEARAKDADRLREPLVKLA